MTTVAEKVSAVRKRGDFYHFNGKQYPAVTSILSVINKPALVPWAIREACDRIFTDPVEFCSYEKVYSGVMSGRDKGANRGAMVHSLAESLERGGEIDVESLGEASRGYGIAFQSFVKTIDPTVIHTEANVYSDKYGYAGTTDLIAILEDEKAYLIDYKTGKDVYRESWLQTAAYKNADFLLAKDGQGTVPMPQIDQTAVVLLKPDGTFTFNVVNGDLQAFLAAKKLWEALKT